MPQIQLNDGGNNSNVELTEGANVGALLQQQGLEAGSLEVLVNGQVAQIDQVLSANDTVFVVPKEDTAPATADGGGKVGIRVGRFPGGKPASIEVETGTTVRESLEQAGFDPRGFDVRRDGQPVDLDAVVEEGDQIVMFRPVQGNQAPADRQAEVFLKYSVRQAAAA